jgi:hypothetical protein
MAVVYSRFAPSRTRAAGGRASLRGPLAQLAEQQTLNLRVDGSIPSRLTSFKPSPRERLTEPTTLESKQGIECPVRFSDEPRAR